MNGQQGDAGCQGSDFETVACDKSDCERFVEYDGDEDLQTDISSICPTVTNEVDVQGKLIFLFFFTRLKFDKLKFYLFWEHLRKVLKNNQHFSKIMKDFLLII
jgi:hypothetical protein